MKTIQTWSRPENEEKLTRQEEQERRIELARTFRSFFRESTESMGRFTAVPFELELPDHEQADWQSVVPTFLKDYESYVQDAGAECRTLWVVSTRYKKMFLVLAIKLSDDDTWGLPGRKNQAWGVPGTWRRAAKLTQKDAHWKNGQTIDAYDRDFTSPGLAAGRIGLSLKAAIVDQISAIDQLGTAQLGRSASEDIIATN